MALLPGGQEEQLRDGSRRSTVHGGEEPGKEGAERLLSRAPTQAWWDGCWELFNLLLEEREWIVSRITC